MVTIFLFYILAASTTVAFHTTPQAPRIISTTSSKSNTLTATTTTLWYKPVKEEEESSEESASSISSEDQQQQDEKKNPKNDGDLFLSQMASNSIQKVQESHPTTKEVKENMNMENLDTKAKMKQWAGPYDQQALRKKLQDRIDTNPVFLLIYGTCPYCAKLLNVLKAYSESNPSIVKRQKMLIVDLDALGMEKYALRTEVMEIVEHNTIPALWVGGQFIGGWEQVQDLQNSSEGGSSKDDDQFQILLENAMSAQQQ